MAAVSAIAVGGCIAPVPQQPIGVSGPVPVTNPGTPGPWVPVPDLIARTYRVEQRAWVVTTTDSGVVADSSVVVVDASVRNVADGSIAGLIQSVIVAAPGTTPGGLPRLALPFAFATSANGRAPVGNQPIPAALPVSDDPCASPVHVPLGAIRDILYRVPDTLFLGRAWADSGTFVTCRDGARLSISTHRQFRVIGSGQHGVLVVDRTSQARVHGRVARGLDTTTVDGSGTGAMRLLVDSASAHLLSADGNSSLEIVVRGATRSERARQDAVSRIVLRDR